MHLAACFLVGGNWGSFVVTCQEGGEGEGGWGGGRGGGEVISSHTAWFLPGPSALPISSANNIRKYALYIKCKSISGARPECL